MSSKEAPPKDSFKNFDRKDLPDAPRESYQRDSYGRDNYEGRETYSSRDYPPGYEKREERFGNYNRREQNYEGRRGSYEGSRGYERRGGYESREGGYERKDSFESGYEKRDYPPHEGEREEGYGRGYGRSPRGFSGGSRKSFGGPKQRSPVPFPTEPPFTAYVGNLPYEIKEDELKDFFEADEIKVANVRLLLDKDNKTPKGFGYVEFEDPSSLEKALQKNGQSIQDRPLRIDIAEAKKSDEKKWDKLKDRKEEELKERPKLQLKKPSESKIVVEPPPAEYSNAKVNPFGSAKPRDENLYLQKFEERKKREVENKSIDSKIQETEKEVSNQAEKERKPKDRPDELRKNNSERPPRKDRPEWKKDKPAGEDRRTRGPRKEDNRSSKKDSFVRKDAPKKDDFRPKKEDFKPVKPVEERETEINENRFAFLSTEDE